VALASTGWDVLSGLLPFVLLFGFWIFLMRRVRGTSPQDGISEKLDEIKHELEGIRRALERRDV
jgi:ATP-dependent Zn protease